MTFSTSPSTSCSSIFALVLLAGCENRACADAMTTAVLDLDGDHASAIHIVTADARDDFLIFYTAAARNLSDQPIRVALYQIANAEFDVPDLLELDGAPPQIIDGWLVGEALIPGRADGITWRHEFPDSGGGSGTIYDWDGPDTHLLVLTSADPVVEVEFEFDETRCRAGHTAPEPLTYEVVTF